MVGRNQHQHPYPYPPWSELPSELISTIANRLTSTPFDFQSFRSVCNSWHSSSSNLLNPSSLSLQLPLKTPLPPLFLGTTCPHPIAQFCLVSVTSIIALHPSKDGENGPNTWVLLLDQLNQGKVCVREPFDKTYSLPLDFPREMNLLDFHAVELGRFYNLIFLRDFDGGDKKIFNEPRVWSDTVLKVVLLNNFGVVALFEEGKLGLFRFGVEGVDAKWDILHDGHGFRFDDIVEFKGRILGIDRRGKVYELDCGELKMIKVSGSKIGGSRKRKRLVESFGVLYLVVRWSNRESTDRYPAFKVYEFNECRRKWYEITSIGDRILFFGVEFSVCISTQDLCGSFRKGSIVYKATSFRCYVGEGIADDHYLYRGNGQQMTLCMGVWHFGAASIEPIESFPGCTHVFWPPPAWIWPDDRSKRLGLLAAAIDILLTGMVDQNLKAELKELSPLVKSLACYENWNQQNLQGFIMQSQKLEKFLKHIYFVIDKEVNCTKKNVQVEANMKLNHSFDIHFWNQRLVEENKEWIANAWRRRLNTHEEVKAILKTLFQFIENHSGNLEDYRRSGKQASPVVGVTRSPMSK